MKANPVIEWLVQGDVSIQYQVSVIYLGKRYPLQKE